ncbi:MAG TPA: hypothetical protein VK625_22265, partial [Flavitalea sp.]|nr:hypothetical protein [Flavitalea sp.]
MKVKVIILLTSLLMTVLVQAQEKLTLDSIFSSIANNHPDLKSFDAKIRALDEAAKGARNWEPPQLTTGLWMTPYNPSLWKKQSDGTSGMGQYMV